MKKSNTFLRALFITLSLGITTWSCSGGGGNSNSTPDRDEVHVSPDKHGDFQQQNDKQKSDAQQKDNSAPAN